MNTTKAPSTAQKTPIKDSVEHALADLETITEEIELKLHLASMDAKTVWSEKLEPKLHAARAHVREAKTVSKAIVQDAVKALKEFAATL